MSATVIAVANQKGGTGKTTTTLNLAAVWAARGRRILAVDADPQGSLTLASGLTRNPDTGELGSVDELGDTLAELMAGAIQATAGHAGRPDYGATVRHADEGFDVIPANIVLSSVELALTAVQYGRNQILSGLLAPLRERYDLILVDCAPTLNAILANVFVASDLILVPTCPQYLSVAGLDILLGVAGKARTENPRLDVLGTVLTIREKRRRGQDEIEDKLRAIPGLPVFGTVVPKSVRAEEAPGRGRSLEAYDPDGPVAAAYRQLADEIDRKLVKE